MNFIIRNNIILDGILEAHFLNNRSFKYGDGVFETILFDKSSLRFWDDHFLRLQEGLIALGILFIENLKSEIYQNIITLIDKNSHKGLVRIRIQFWRCEGGYYTPTNNNYEYLIESSNYNLAPKQNISIDVCENIELNYTKISHLKTCNSIPYIIASLEKTKKNLDDVIILDANGNIAEATAANIFWVCGDKWFTPSLHTGCIGGVMRKNIISKLKSINKDIIEGEFPVSHLQTADSILLTNVMSIKSVTNFRDIVYDQHKSEQNLKFIQILMQ